jgi:TonB family protein
MKRLMFICFSVVPLSSFAQIKEYETDKYIIRVDNNNDTTIIAKPTMALGSKWKFVGDMPQAKFRGDMQAFIKQTMHYPPDAQKSKTEGTVRVYCKIDKQGQIDNPIVTHFASSSIDAEAIRIIKQMPAWEPAQKDGKAFDSWQSVEITFKL